MRALGRQLLLCVLLLVSSEPFVLGKNRLPSTAFCIVYRLCEMKLSHNQMYSMLAAKSNVLVRGLGVLFLRYACDPDHLWSWFEPHMDDTTEFAPLGDKSIKL
jgi:pre-mRNA-splicing factor 38B